MKSLKVGGERGVSILEMSIVISILAVLNVIAFPYWDQILDTYRLSTSTGILTSDLRLARFDAVKNDYDVRVRSLTSTSYVEERDSAGVWVPLRPAVDLSERFWTRGIEISGWTSPTVFHSDGRAGSPDTLQVENRGEENKRISISASGMVRQL